MKLNEFSFGGIESSVFDITCGTERHSILPATRKYVQEVPGLDGVVDFNIGGHEVRVITLPIYFDGNYADLRANREKIIAWLHNDGTPKRLVFGNAPERYYLAKIYDAIDFENVDDRHIGDLQFECNPPWQILEDGTVLTPEQLLWVNCERDVNQFVKEFTSSGSMRFVNKGLPVKPIIKIIGNIQSGITLTYGTQNLKINYDCRFDGIVVDCNNETVTQLSDGENLYSFIDGSKDDFFEFNSGNVELQISQDNISEYPNSIIVMVEMQTMKGG